ncbi:MAG: polysaccharide deacetylase family protein [Methylococcaceae bacterium]
MNSFNEEIKKIAKTAIINILSNELVLKRKLDFIKKYNALTILNLHRVAEFDSSSYPPLSPHLFEELLIFIKKNFDIISFESLRHNATKNQRPKLILSFDDGYKDFIDIAVPILEKHKITVNQNIIPYCIEKQLPPLNVIAQDFIGKAPESLLLKLDIPDFNLSYHQINNRLKFGFLVSKFLKNRPMQQQNKLSEYLMPQFYNFKEFKITEMMSIYDIQELIDTHEIGVHSFYHASMAYETKEYFEKDLISCNEYFIKKLNRPAEIYAFPNGEFTKEQREIIEQSNYQTILLVENKFNTNTHTKTYSRFGFHANNIAEVYFNSLGGMKWKV